MNFSANDMVQLDRLLNPDNETTKPVEKTYHTRSYLNPGTLLPQLWRIQNRKANKALNQQINQWNKLVKELIVDV